MNFNLKDEIQAFLKVYFVAFVFCFHYGLLGQSPWSMAMCLVWQSVLLGNG